MGADSAVTIAVVGVLATCVGGLLWVLKFVFTKLIPRLDKGNEAFERIVKATLANTKATKSADEYLRKRNGHDAELHKELIGAIGEIPAQIVKTATITAKTLQDAPLEQHIQKQVVDKQVVNGK